MLSDNVEVWDGEKRCGTWGEVWDRGRGVEQWERCGTGGEMWDEERGVGRGRGRRDGQEEGDVHISMADSCCSYGRNQHNIVKQLSSN